MRDVKRDMVRAILIGTAIVTVLIRRLQPGASEGLRHRGHSREQGCRRRPHAPCCGRGGSDHPRNRCLPVVAHDTERFDLHRRTLLVRAGARRAAHRAVWRVGRSWRQSRERAALAGRAIADAGRSRCDDRDGFSTMVDYTAPVFWFFLLLVGLAVFVFRFREPERARPFKVPLYPLTPAIFVAICAYLLYSSLAYTGFGPRRRGRRASGSAVCVSREERACGRRRIGRASCVQSPNVYEKIVFFSYTEGSLAFRVINRLAACVAPW